MSWVEQVLLSAALELSTKVGVGKMPRIESYEENQ